MTFANKIDKLLEENNLKNLRQLSQELDIPYTTLWDYYSIPIRLEKANLTYIKKIAKRLGCTVDYLAYEDVTDPNSYSILNTKFNNATIIDIDTNTIKIPVYGTIKAGIPIESQSDIIDYIEIPFEWTKGGKSFYALKISGDSMFPKYCEDDIVIFEQNEDVEMYNGKDCAIMINSSESTFKKVSLNENGIELKPYNRNYKILTYTCKEVEELPIKILGIAVEIRKKVSNLSEEDKKLIEMAKDLEEITKEDLESLSALDNILYENKGKIDSVRNLPTEKQQIIANAVKSVLDLVDDNENKL